MDKGDIEFTVSLNTSPAERKLDILFEKMRYPVTANYRGFDNIGNTNASGFIPNTPKNIITTNAFGGSNLPVTALTRDISVVTRELEKVFSFFRAQSQGISGWRFAGSSYWNEQKKIGYDNLPTFSSGNGVQRPIQYIYTQKALPGWKHAGSSEKYDEFEDLFVDPTEPANERKKPSTTPNDIKYEMHPWQKKSMSDVNKKDNIELKDKLLLWSKILATVYAVKKVVEGLVKAWKFGADVATSRNSNIDEEGGYFSTDPVGAMRSNVDRTRSILYAGVRNMGENAPVSKEGLDYFSSKITEMWTAAMSGRNVDARTTIDVQRLKDFFGIDLSPAELLTGEREGRTATDIQIDVLKKVESQLKKLDEADEITKGQVIDSLKNVLGEEMINAIVSNYNKNLKIDSSDLRMDLVDRIMSAGGSAMSPQDLTEKTTSAVKALSEFQLALETLKNTITVTFEPAFVSVTNTLTEFVNWLNKKMTKTTGDKQSDVAFEAIGSAKSEPKTVGSFTNSGEDFGTWGERTTKASNFIKGAKNANDVLNAIALLNPLVRDEGSAEDLRKRRLTREAGEALLSGNLDPNSSNQIIQKLAKYSYGGKTGIEAIRLAAKHGVINTQGMGMLQDLLYSPEEFEEKTVEDFLPKNYNSLSESKKEKKLADAQKKLEKYNAQKNKKKFGAVNQLRSTDFMGNILLDLFGEGGALDYTPSDQEFYDYVLDPYSYETADDYYDAIRQLKESFEQNRWGREYISSFELPSKEELYGSDKTLDFGEVKFKIVLTDEKGTVLESRDISGTVNSLVQ